MDHENGDGLKVGDVEITGLMRSYDFGEPASTGGLSFGRMGYRYFDVEEVLRDGKPIGEYHIKLKTNATIKSAVIFFRDKMPGFTVGAVSLDEVLKLEYPIYAKAGEMAMSTLDSLPEMFRGMDEFLHEHRSGRRA